jgi:hypothetical protein
MRDIQLYAKDAAGVYQRLELFKGDAVTITDSIKNAKDPAKVFTTFSQQFTVPASKVNNKIFKHYYNYGIENTFDARRKTDSYIEINSIPFKTGKLSLDGVDLRNNKPYAYRVTFYGGIVDLKDIFREDKLPSLTVGDASLDINKPYNAADILTALTSADAADGTHIPLITVGQRLYYNSGVGSDQSGNLHYNTSANQGVKHDQLKYAIKIAKVIEAIESKYSQITFDSESFFKAGDKFMFNQLYLWCHRKKGEDTITAGAPQQVSFEYTENSSYLYIDANSGLRINTLNFTNVEIDLVPAVNGNRYNAVVHKNGSVFTRLDNLTGSVTINVQSGTDPIQVNDYFEVFIETYENAVNFSTLRWDVSLYQNNNPQNQIVNIFINASQLNYASSFLFNIASSLPEMKIIDFLSSLFKMFNLVAFVQTNGSVQVKTLDEFFSSTETDITKYVDIEKSQVNVALPYREITFKYKDSNTILAKQHYQEIAEVDANGRGPFEWGAVEYTDVDPDTLSGGSYKIEPDFHHMKFERILDLYNNDDTNVQWGHFVDDNQETYLGSPLLFYSSATTPNKTLSFLGPTGTQTFGDGIVRMPSNFRVIDSTTSENLHFNPEISEFTRAEGEETLFKQFYEKYIENLFSKRTRLIKVSCVLPVNILVQINLSDVIVLSGQKYRINSYSANLITGRTDFELINYYD